MDRMPKRSEVGRLRESIAALEESVSARERELSESLRQQAATAGVLNAISRSTSDLQTVLDGLVVSAAQLCDADHAWLFRRDGDAYRWAASYGHSTQEHERVREFFRSQRIAPGRGTLIGRTALEGKPVMIADALADPEYKWRAAQQVGNYRTTFGVPLLRGSDAIGVLALTRSMVRPFTDRQIALATTFADQAVIAIENARLFEELQRRNREIAAALEQQTATAEILRVISASPTNVGPVFETIVANAARLCEAHFAFVMVLEQEQLRLAAHTACTPEFAAYLRDGIALSRATTTGRAALDRKPVQVFDFPAEPGAVVTAAHRIEGVRTVLAVPMCRGSALLGVISVWRREVRPFSEDQIKLLETFASQAVIAIANVRLFDEIQDKNRQLELASTSKSRFLAAASHDLRQPLHALNLFVAQLRAETDPGERARLVARVDAAVRAMNELFDALLDMSRLDAGVLAPERVAFPVAYLLERIETTFAEAAREKGLRLRVVSSSTWVRSDFVLLARILFNLVSNAVRYTASGGIVVGVRRRGERLRIDVCDTGLGIPEDQQRNIFGEFYQVADTHADRRSGLGLGLAIVDRLARLLEHPIDLASRPQQGSRFSISVPLAPASRGSGDVTMPEAPMADLVRGKLVVVIDDDSLALEGMRGILRSWGCVVVTAASVDAVLAALAEQRGRVDLIVSDYHLPDGQTGTQAIERLRKKLGTEIPAFLISGDTAPDRMREVRECGHYILHKPVSPIALRAMLNRFLQGTAPSAEPRDGRSVPSIPPPAVESTPGALRR